MDYLAELRAAGLSQTDVARRLGVSVQVLNHYLHGRRGMPEWVAECLRSELYAAAMGRLEKLEAAAGTLAEQIESLAPVGEPL